jgi:ceramide glucosyltransferase
VTLAALLLVVVAGSCVYSVLTVVAARRYLSIHPPPNGSAEPVSVLKPLHGAEDSLEANLRSFFTQAYPSYELLFAVRSRQDPAVEVVCRLQAEFPCVPARLLITGEPPYPNAKVFSLDCMLAEARWDLLVMSDSDIRVTPEFLETVAAEFSNSKVGLATCPYRAVPGRSFWSRLEAIGMNTHFLAGVLVARLLEGMKFAVGPTIVARKRVLEAIGGFSRLKDYLAEDFVMGKFAAEAGWGVILSSYRVEHHIGSQPCAANLRHRLRWSRSTRRSRPAGYLGELFTFPVPLALLLGLLKPPLWPAAALALGLRAWSAWSVGQQVLRDPLVRRKWWLVPVQDMLAFLVWVAGFFGNTVTWRGRRYHLYPDGRFALLNPAPHRKRALL